MRNALIPVAVVLLAATACGTDPSGLPKAAAPATASTQADAKSTTTGQAHTPEGDVKLTRCEVDEFGKYPVATLTLVNHSADTSNYVVSVAFIDSTGTQVGDGTAAVSNLAHGHKAIDKAYGLEQADGKITCRVAKVERYASL
ncbi:FxLYD domain-containing protein [Streptomyces sp900129855]|uniref:FxLYD domain-containing protein n=1 Tax=Streptomyces sp. 900129855 TaxID=3155129 RepID=A0ABV2ZRP4_9ACTN